MARGVGEEAPDFTLPASTESEVHLRDFRGNWHVLLVFYSFSYDEVCRQDLRRLRELADRFRAASTRIVAVSCDPQPVQHEWALAESLPFPLLSDFWPHGEVSEAYGVFERDRGCARHVAFTVDMSGRIAGVSESDFRSARKDEVYERVLAGLAAEAAEPPAAQPVGPPPAPATELPPVVESPPAVESLPAPGEASPPPASEPEPEAEPEPAAQPEPSEAP